MMPVVSRVLVAPSTFLMFLFLGGQAPPETGGTGTGPMGAKAMPQVPLFDGGAWDAIPAVDRSFIGNLRDPLKPAMTRDHAAMQVQISRKHAQIAQISLGNPPQKLNCLIDSGSADLWMPSKRCHHCESNNSFNADASRTFKPELYGKRPRAVRIAYGSGEVVGYAVHDTLHFGSMQLQNQAFIIVEDSALPGGRMWDGICGLGWKGIAQVRPTLYENIQHHHHRALFAIVPSMGTSDFPSSQGITQAHMMVGEVPHASIKPGTLVYVPAEKFDPAKDHLGNQLTFWMVSGHLQINAPKPIPARFLVDTGTNQVLLVPQNHYHLFIRSLIPPRAFEEHCGNDPRAGVICDCRIQHIQGLRPLQIYFSGRSFALPVSEMFVKAPSTDGGELCLLTIQPNMMTGGVSTGGIIGDLLGGILGKHWGGNPYGGGVEAASPSEHWMIGGVFLEHFVTIFDFDNGRMGFAEPRKTARPSTNNLTKLWASREKNPPLVMERPQDSWTVPTFAAILICSATLAGTCFMATRWRLMKTFVHDGSCSKNSVSNDDVELLRDVQ